MRLPTLSTAGALFVGAWEGFSAICYDDGGAPGRGNATIGYGHLLHYGPTTAADRRRWGAINREQAAHLLQADALHALFAIERSVTVALTQPQTDALCSLAFNAGAGALEHAVRAAVNSKPRLPWPLNVPELRRWHERVGAALLLWDHVGGVVSPGLERRRRSEGELFATGRYTIASGNRYANA